MKKLFWIPVIISLFLLTGCAFGQKAPADLPDGADEASIEGVYISDKGDGSELEITRKRDNLYNVRFSITRLTEINDFNGLYENGVLSVTGLDAAGEVIKAKISFSDGSAEFTITETTWQYFENDRQFTFKLQ